MFDHAFKGIMMKYVTHSIIVLLFSFRIEFIALRQTDIMLTFMLTDLCLLHVYHFFRF